MNVPEIYLHKITWASFNCPYPKPGWRNRNRPLRKGQSKLLLFCEYRYSSGIWVTTNKECTEHGSWVFTRLTSEPGHFSPVTMGRIRVITLVKHSGNNNGNVNFIALVTNVDVFVRGASNSSCFVDWQSSFLQSSVWLKKDFFSLFITSVFISSCSISKTKNNNKQLLSNVPSTIFSFLIKRPTSSSAAG